MRTRKIVIIALLVGLGLVLHLVENMLPLSFIIPGAKLGLANIANLLGLIIFGFIAGLQILLLRIFLGSILAGTFMTINFYLSLTGGLLGYLIMSLFFYYFRNWRANCIISSYKYPSPNRMFKLFISIFS